MSRETSTDAKICLKRSTCPIANTLDLVGDLMQSPEGIPSNILADRLKRLEAAELVVKKPYQHNPVRYEYHLTPKGTDLLPVLQEVIRWGNKHVPGTYVPPPELLQRKSDS